MMISGIYFLYTIFTIWIELKDGNSERLHRIESDLFALALWSYILITGFLHIFRRSLKTKSPAMADRDSLRKRNTTCLETQR